MAAYLEEEKPELHCLFLVLIQRREGQRRVVAGWDSPALWAGALLVAMASGSGAVTVRLWVLLLVVLVG